MLSSRRPTPLSIDEEIWRSNAEISAAYQKCARDTSFPSGALAFPPTEPAAGTPAHARMMAARQLRRDMLARAYGYRDAADRSRAFAEGMAAEREWRRRHQPRELPGPPLMTVEQVWLLVRGRPPTTRMSGPDTAATRRAHDARETRKQLLRTTAGSLPGKENT